MRQRDTKDDQGYHSYITKAFGRWARFYDPFLALFRLKGVRRETVGMSGVRPEDRVLDICTGTGDVALEFAKRCDNMMGIDLSAEMLAVARRKDRENKVRFLQMDATRLAFADNSFNVGIISLGLHDMPLEVKEEALREMARVTRQRIVIVDYNPPKPYPAGPLHRHRVAMGVEVFPGVCQKRFRRVAGRLRAAGGKGEANLLRVSADMRLL